MKVLRLFGVALLACLVAMGNAHASNDEADSANMVYVVRGVIKLSMRDIDGARGEFEHIAPKPEYEGGKQYLLALTSFAKKDVEGAARHIGNALLEAVNVRDKKHRFSELRDPVHSFFQALLADARKDMPGVYTALAGSRKHYFWNPNFGAEAMCIMLPILHAVRGELPEAYLYEPAWKKIVEWTGLFDEGYFKFLVTYLSGDMQASRKLADRYILSAPRDDNWWRVLLALIAMREGTPAKQLYEVIPARERQPIMAWMAVSLETMPERKAEAREIYLELETMLKSGPSYDWLFGGSAVARKFVEVGLEETK